MNVDAESAVRDRYGRAAGKSENALCCPIEYDTRYLKVIPNEVIEKDYGCGDPSRWLKLRHPETPSKTRNLLIADSIALEAV